MFRLLDYRLRTKRAHSEYTILCAVEYFTSINKIMIAMNLILSEDYVQRGRKVCVHPFSKIMIEINLVLSEDYVQRGEKVASIPLV